jgi:flagellar basal-body rod protein FlgC
MISAINSTVSALQAYKTQMEVASHNVANLNTENFKKSKATLKEGDLGEVPAKVDRINIPDQHYRDLEGFQMVDEETSNVDLAEEFPQLMTSQHAYEANMKVVQNQDRVLGTTLDIFS